LEPVSEKRGVGDTYTENGPGLDRWVSGVQGRDIFREDIGDFGWRVLAKPGAKILLLLLGVGGIPGAEY
jgi:hypothetical protein